jgi:hypothetical protein
MTITTMRFERRGKPGVFVFFAVIYLDTLTSVGNCWISCINSIIYSLLTLAGDANV